MSHNHSSVLTKHIKKKAKQDVEQHHINPSSRRTMNLPTLEPRRDLPLHKIPELLAKITGTLSSTLSSSSSASESRTTLIDRREQLFTTYSDEQHAIMSIDGILQFCSDLSIEPDSYELLLFCFLCRAKQMYSLTKEEFFRGLKTLSNSANSFFELRQILVNYPIQSYENEFYLWIYHYGLIDGQRCLTTPNAISLWRLFYSKDFEKPLIFNQWLEYLENEIENEIPKTITCDTWSIFPQFARFIQLHGYQAYDDNEAWPCLFDDFVEYSQKSKSRSIK